MVSVAGVKPKSGLRVQLPSDDQPATAPCNSQRPEPNPDQRRVMNTAERQSLAAIPPIVLIGGGIAWAGSQGGAQPSGIPLLALCWILAFAVNWVAFVPSRGCP